MDCIPTPQHQPSPAPLPEMERSATPQHQPSPTPSIPEMEHSGTDPLRHQPSLAPSIPVECSATPPRQSIPPQPPHIASPQRQPIPPAPPVMDCRDPGFAYVIPVTIQSYEEPRAIPTCLSRQGQVQDTLGKLEREGASHPGRMIICDGSS